MRYMETNSGKRFVTTDLNLMDFSIGDLILGTSREPRWGGQLEINFSALQHMILCYEIARHLKEKSNRILFLTLVHDLQEGICKDIPSPIKAVLGEVYQKLESAASALMYKLFSVKSPTEEEKVTIKQYDMIAMSYEANNQGLNKTGWTEENYSNFVYPLVERPYREVIEEYVGILNKLYLSMGGSHE